MPIAAWTEDLLKDLRYAIRQFTRNPVFHGGSSRVTGHRHWRQHRYF